MVGMRSPARPRRAALVVLVVSLLAALLATAPGPAAQAADDKVRVYGGIRFPQKDSPAVKMLWFDRDWNYLGQQWASGGSYAIKLPGGTYHLQFVDQRKPWETEKYAPTDVQVTVGARPVEKNVTMQRGAAITGTARAGGKPLPGARIVAAKSSTEQSFTTTANGKGQFAVAGLPKGRYCLFTYDRAREYVDKCTWVGAVDAGQIKDRAITLTKRAGSLRIFIDTADRKDAPRSIVTVKSTTTGQWWTTKSSVGEAKFRGLYPGRYTISYEGTGVWFTQAGAVRNARVKPGLPDFGDFRLTKRGGWITGNVVDSLDPSRALSGAVVQLWSASGVKLDETTSGSDGFYVLDGQLATQSGLTIVVQPGPYTDYLGVEPARCQYAATTNRGFSVVIGEENYVGEAAVINRKPGQTRPECAVPENEARR